MYRLFLFLIVLFASWTCGFSQIKVTTELEAGINSSANRLRDVIYIDPSIYKPVISPLFGFWTKVKFGKRFSYYIGAQYLKVGYKLHEQRDRINEYHNYSTDEWTSVSFQKISVPMTIAYDFKLKKRTSTIYLGIKRNYFLKGEIKGRLKVTDHNDPTNNSDNTHKDDPFAEGVYVSPASRINRGIFLGWGVAISKNLSINLNYSLNQYTHWGRGCFGYSYDNNDLTFSLKYSIFSGVKKH